MLYNGIMPYVFAVYWKSIQEKQNTICVFYAESDNPCGFSRKKTYGAAYRRLYNNVAKAVSIKTGQRAWLQKNLYKMQVKWR